MSEDGITTVESCCISWTTQSADEGTSAPFRIQKMKSRLLLRTEQNDANEFIDSLYLESDCSPDEPFDLSVQLVVRAKVVSHCRTTVRGLSEMIWSGNESEMLEAVPDIEDFECELLLFRIVLLDKDENLLPKDSSTDTDLGFDSLSRDLEKLLDQEDTSADVELKCGDRAFKAHKCLLSSRSEVFASMLRSDMLEGRTGRVEIRDTEAGLFGQFLRYLYSGKLPELTPDTAVLLYEMGDQYSVDVLKVQCRVFLKKNLTRNNACDVLVLADQHSDPDLKQSTIAYIMDQKIPLKGDVWTEFCSKHPVLSNEVLNRFCQLLSSSIALK